MHAILGGAWVPAEKNCFPHCWNANIMRRNERGERPGSI